MKFPFPVPPPTPADFRHVMGRFGTGVTVMTCHVGGEPHGMTANAVASVSLDPLLVLVCVDHEAEMWRLVPDAQAFALSILPADAVDLSDHFADGSRPSGHAQFTGVDTKTAATGSPILRQSIGWLDCSVWKIHDGGDHDIVVGEVRACEVGADAAALGYYRSQYVSIELPS